MTSLRKIFSKADNFLGSTGHQLVAGSTAPIGIIFLCASEPVAAGALFTIAMASAWRADAHEKAEKAQPAPPSSGINGPSPD